jgi:nucleotide-binding universal stress UspA family protein
MLAAMLGPEDQDDLDLETVVAIGDVGAEVESVAHQQHADVIVMGTHGRGLLRRWLIGSVTQALLRKIDIPILTVCHGRRPLSFKRIMFATDFSEPADRGLDFALDLAKTLNARLIVAHVIDKRPAVSYETPEISAIFDAEQRQSRLDTEAGFKLIESRARTKNVKVQPVIAQGIPAEALVRVADENTVDFVVLAVGRKSRMDRILLGTTAEQLIREATIPVLSVPVHPVERSNHEVDKVPNAGTQANSPGS